MVGGGGPTVEKTGRELVANVAFFQDEVKSSGPHAFPPAGIRRRDAPIGDYMVICGTVIMSCRVVDNLIAYWEFSLIWN